MSIYNINTTGVNNTNAIDNYSLNLLDDIKDTSTKTSNNSSIFETFLDASSKMYNTTNELQKDVAQKQLEFATGQSDDVLGVMLAQEKATTALSFTVQITNKVLESYKEIMQIQL